MDENSVTGLVTKIKSLLEGEFRQVFITGEITNLSQSSSGHWYFSLSDRDSSIGCALFKSDGFRNPMIRKLKNGDQVFCHGQIGVYGKRGTFQLIVKRITLAGKGELIAKFEELKRKLATEGLFDIDIKTPIPTMPEKVAIITALQGAALQDFIKIYQRRSLWMNIMIIPALVQGIDAPQSIINAMNLLERYLEKKKVDILVLARGGGSLEDLWAFNDESLARKIHSFPIPVISAIGHQTDFTISDFVSDLRCETPSAAAEVISMKQTRITEHLTSYKKIILGKINALKTDAREKMERNNPKSIKEKLVRLLYTGKEKLEKLNLEKRAFELLRIHEKLIYLDELSNRLKNRMSFKLTKHLTDVEKYHNLLDALNPENVLERGYSMIRDDNNFVVDDLDKFYKLDNGHQIKIQFKNGTGNAIKTS